MKIKAQVNFAGIVTMSIGNEREVDDAVAKDLIKAGYAEDVTPAPPVVTPETPEDTRDPEDTPEPEAQETPAAPIEPETVQPAPKRRTAKAAEAAKEE